MTMSYTSQTRERALSHKDYLDTLLRPSAAQTRRISDIQIQKEHEIDSKYHTVQEHEAATRIQRAYRGHRERRQLEGLTLDPSSRWIEVIREWRFRTAISPNPPAAVSTSDGRLRAPSDVAKANWRKAGEIAEHAGAGDVDSTPKSAARQRSGTQDSMLLDLRYFLEMVDQKHRYGTNLQAYHDEWLRSGSNQNFFVWLDQGEGKELDLPVVSREKLDREQIRYLSKEERMDYLVQIDDMGQLRWMKNDEPITTSVDQYQDSMDGIVPKGTAEVVFSDEIVQQQLSFNAEPLPGESPATYGPTTDFPPESSSDSDSIAETPIRLQDSKPRRKKKHMHVSPATILNSLLRASVRPGTWIYVADTVGRLYVGIKDSGAFQHASFLSGSRISSAGAIGIENGKLVYLSPLSGHYRPTTKSFRVFVESLKEQGADLSSLKVSKAYAVLLGMEYYGKTKGEVKKIFHHEKHVDGTRTTSPRDSVHEEENTEVKLSEEKQEDAHRERHRLSRLLKDLNLRRHGSS